MFPTLYIVSVLLTSVSFLRFYKKFNKKIQEEGYKFQDNENITLKKFIILFIEAGVLVCVPLMNLLFLLSFEFDTEKTYKDLKQRFIKEGFIYKEDENDDNNREYPKENKDRLGNDLPREIGKPNDDERKNSIHDYGGRNSH